MTALLLLLQLVVGETQFQKYLRQAQEKLGIAQSQVVVSDDLAPGFVTESPYAAWVPYGPGARGDVVYVRPWFLRDSNPLTQEIVALHESCHLYLGTSRRTLLPGEDRLQHLMIDGCVEWLLGPRHHQVMQAIPCGRWYPYEALRYNRRINKEKCR